MPTPAFDVAALLSTPAATVAFAPTWPGSKVAAFPPPSIRDVYWGGRGVIAGSVKEKALPSDLPLRRRTWLLRERDGRVIRETWSDPVTGAYSFSGIDERERYTVLAYDHEHDHRAVVADNLLPELMP